MGWVLDGGWLGGFWELGVVACENGSRRWLGPPIEGWGYGFHVYLGIAYMTHAWMGTV